MTLNRVAADQRVLAIFARAGHSFASLEDAWTQAPFPSPLLGYVVAGLSDVDTFGRFCSFLRLVAETLTVDPTAGGLQDLERVRAGTTAERNRAAFDLGERRNRAIIDGEPITAAFADALTDVAEVYADPEAADPENDPFLRARAAITALIEATLMGQDKSPDDKVARQQAARALLDLFRQTFPAP